MEKVSTFVFMTPEKRLNQLEPIVADVARKVDRLIESNGLILNEVSKIPLLEKNVSIIEKNVHKIATGLAELTIHVNQRFAQQQIYMDQRFERIETRLDQQQQQIDTLRSEMQEGFKQVNNRFDQLFTLITDRLK